MARRKAEAVEKIELGDPSLPEAMASLQAATDAFFAGDGVETATLASRTDMIRENMERRQATLDHIEQAMSAIPSMTDRAAINALAEAVADLARMMR